MTTLAQSGLDEAIVEILTRIGFDSVEQFLGAADVAGPELAACLPQPLGQIIHTASRQAMQIPAAKQQELTDLACPLGAQLEAPARSETVTRTVASLVPATLSNVSLIHNMPPIWDQGDRPICVAFATLAAYECHLARKGSHHTLSSQYLYWNCKRNDRIPNQEGTWVATAYSLLHRDGCCADAHWPYNSQPSTSAHRF